MTAKCSYSYLAVKYFLIKGRRYLPAAVYIRTSCLLINRQCVYKNQGSSYKHADVFTRLKSVMVQNYVNDCLIQIVSIIYKYIF